MLSQPCRAVFIFCRLTQISFTPRYLSLKRREHLSIASNPTSKLPLLQDGNFSLSESHAILTYLCSTRKCADHWYPTDKKARAVCDQFLHWHHSGLRRIERYLHYWLEERREGGVPAGLVDGFMAEMHDAMRRLDAWLAGKTFILGREISIYDISAVCEIAEMKLIPGLLESSLEKYSNLKRWFAHVYSIPEVLSAHELIEKIAVKYSTGAKL